MAAHPKLTYPRETRLLALLVFGEPLECACRAIGISSTAVRKRMKRDTAFAARVRAARDHRQALGTPGERVGDELFDWQAAAERLERIVPERWAPPPGPWDEPSADLR